MLHKTSRMRGYHIEATDGSIGHVDNFLVDESSWAVRYLVVDTTNWIGGRWVLVSSSAIRSVDSVEQKIHVALSRDEIKNSPSVEEANIALVETLPTVWLM